MGINLREICHELPVWNVSGQVNEALRNNRDVVLTAAPGAGKSTLIPLTVLQGAFPAEGRILMLEPRRLAARQIAERMAFLAGQPVGQTVGYSIRFERKLSAQTRIEVVTEGILTRRLLSDPTMDGVAAVIFDEFHERSLESDLALALVRDCCRTLRPDLRIIIMSATIDSQEICRSLNAVHIDSPGKMFPVETFHSPKDIDPRECAREVARAVSIACRQHDGDVLAFLPGESEIRHCAELMDGALAPDINVFPLYGMLGNDQQREAIAPSLPGRRKVVLATSIAETSITIEGVRVVIDSGLCRKMVFDARNGLSHLETVRVSLDMAAQRRGRAGRTAPGHCYRLWTEATEKRLEDCRRPEILDADLCPCMLSVATWEGSGVEGLPWMTRPPQASVTLAQRSLMAIGAIDSNGAVTPDGKRIAALPCHPRIARMLMTAPTPANKALAARIAAVLEERTVNGTELSEVINGSRSDRIRKATEQYCNMAGVRPDESRVDSQDCGALLALAWPEHIAKAVAGRQGYFLTADGQMIFADRQDDICTAEWIVAANVSARQGAEGKIFLAAMLNPSDVESLAREIRNVSWNGREGKVVARIERRIGKLALSANDISEIGDEELLSAICQAAAKEGLSMFDFSDDVQNLQRRIAMVAQWHPELELPSLSTEAVLDRIEEWGPVYLKGLRSGADLKKLDMTAVIWSMLDYGQQKQVDMLAPTHIEVPTGSRIKIEYRTGAELPVLRVRLQECFGMTDTPRVNGGQLPVLMELLSPGYKPVQLTSDLRSFWSGTYFQVRKELRLRYPKHSWPENPLEAQAVRGVKKRG